MDNRPIGFFDSGLGGLTCISYLLDALPHERIVYFGDTARTPYGSKAPETIRKFAFEIADFLIETQDVKMIAIACNTVTAVALDDLRERHPEIPFLGIISPAAEAVAKNCGPKNHIGVIGTKATIASGDYPKKIRDYGKALEIHQQACPAIVPLVEEGIIQNPIMDMMIRFYLDDFIKEKEIDTLVLGCTHYPLVRKNITALYPALRIIDPSEEVQYSILNMLEKKNLCASIGGSGQHVFYASDLSENFVNMINLIFPDEGQSIVFSSVDLERYVQGKEEVS